MVAVFIRFNAVYNDFPRRWNQNPGQHLDRCRFSRAVRSDVANTLPIFNGKANVLYRLFRHVLPGKNVLYKSPCPTPSFLDFEVFADMRYFYHLIFPFSVTRYDVLSFYHKKTFFFLSCKN